MLVPEGLLGFRSLSIPSEAAPGITLFFPYESFYRCFDCAL